MTVYDIAAGLPPIDVLRDRCKAFAMLECVIGGGEPFYAYTRAWGADEAALMSNGSGDEWAVVFTADGAFIRVFDHESPMTDAAVQSLNPEATVAGLGEDTTAVGYPTAPGALHH